MTVTTSEWMTMSLGIDLERADRFSGGRGDATLQPLFTVTELAWCTRSRRPEQRLAGTWCAKEAVVKALWPWVRLDPRRVCVERSDDGVAHVTVLGWDAGASGVTVQVTISRPGPLVSAFAVAFGQRPITGEPLGYLR